MHGETFNNYINGEWLSGASTIINVSPANLQDRLGTYAQADTAQVEQAINAAILGQAQWQLSGLEQRYQVLMAIGDELIERKAELGEQLDGHGLAGA